MPAAAFLSAWQATGREEGGYVHNPSDSGGETNWGITARIARAYGYQGDMRSLPRSLAREIAKRQYWDANRLDEVAALSLPVAHELFDTGLNVGPALAAQWLQRCLRVALPGKPLQADGHIGGLTLQALKAFLARRGDDGVTVLLRALNSFQSVHYTELCERREKDELFWFGWQLRRITLR
jgi:lysozyme family protein